MQRQIDNPTKQVRIGLSLHNVLRIKAAQKQVTLRALVEELLGWRDGRLEEIPDSAPDSPTAQ